MSLRAFLLLAGVLPPAATGDLSFVPCAAVRSKLLAPVKATMTKWEQENPYFLVQLATDLKAVNLGTCQFTFRAWTAGKQTSNTATAPFQHAANIVI